MCIVFPPRADPLKIFLDFSSSILSPGSAFQKALSQYTEKFLRAWIGLGWVSMVIYYVLLDNICCLLSVNFVELFPLAILVL